MSDPRLVRLRQLAELVRLRAAAELAANRTADAALCEKIDALRSAAVDTAPELFQRAGNAELWRVWRGREIAALNRDRANLRREAERAEAAAARATARVQALDRLLAGDRA